MSRVEIVRWSTVIVVVGIGVVVWNTLLIFRIFSESLLLEISIFYSASEII